MEFSNCGHHCEAPLCHQQGVYSLKATSIGWTGKCHDYFNRMPLVSDFLPFTCDACRKTFCLEHRTYSSHSCRDAGQRGEFDRTLFYPMIHLTNGLPRNSPLRSPRNGVSSLRWKYLLHRWPRVGIAALALDPPHRLRGPSASLRAAAVARHLAHAYLVAAAEVSHACLTGTLMTTLAPQRAPQRQQQYARRVQAFSRALPTTLIARSPPRLCPNPHMGPLRQVAPATRTAVSGCLQDAQLKHFHRMDQSDARSARLVLRLSVR